ncbi:hypothetical protein EXW96_19180 [Paenibacillus sp. JMULE4]|nr:hypothetical protein [Paenibacillus sp. JMULE4]
MNDSPIGEDKKSSHYPNADRRSLTMKIETKSYQVARLPKPSESETVSIIQEAESKLSGLTGQAITLIAYSKSEEGDSHA